MGSENTDSVIKIRAAENRDSVAVVDLFDEAFSSKFVHAVKDTQLRRKFWAEILQFAQVFVADREGEIVGMTLMSFAESPGFKKVGARQLVKMLGPTKAVRAAFIFILFSKLDWKPTPNHAYLEAISVSATARGMGVGSLLLSHSMQLVKERGLQALELSVVFENKDAKRLYLKQGFDVVHSKKSPLLRAFTGVAGADVMRSS